MTPMFLGEFSHCMLPMESGINTVQKIKSWPFC